MIDLTMDKYTTAVNIKKMKEKEVIIDNIIEELDNKRDIVRNKMKKALLKDEVSIYRLEEKTYSKVFCFLFITISLFLSSSSMILSIIIASSSSFC